MTELVTAIGFAIIISGCCSLFEAVLYSVPLRHIESLSREGKKAGKIFKEIRTHIEKPIAAILSLNTIANTAGAAVAGSAAAAVFGNHRIALFSAFFTLAILLFSEIIPKTAGVVYGQKLISPVAYSLRFLIWIMAPAIWLSGLVTRIIARKKLEDQITDQELRVMVNLSRRSGGITLQQENAIENVLTLQSKIAREVMTPRTVIFSLPEDLSLEQAQKVSEKWEHSRFPVYGNDPEDISGIVFTKELFMALSTGKTEIKLSELSKPVHFVAETARLNRVLMEFLERKEHMFVVIDEYGGLSGLITLEDILEEILGREIMDESDQVADKQALARARRGKSAKAGRMKNSGPEKNRSA
jgi:CBS domain containing-hemolysin-like protein